MPPIPSTKACNKGARSRPALERVNFYILLLGHHSKDLRTETEQHKASEGIWGQLALGRGPPLGTAFSPGQLAEGTWSPRAGLLSPASQTNRSWRAVLQAPLH